MPRPDVSAERKPQILQAAARVFMRKGIDAARMEDVAHEAGLSVGGIYWYFKSKEALVLALMETVMNQDLIGLREQLLAPGTMRERLRGYVQTSLAAARDSLPLTYEIYSLAGRDAMVRAHLKSYFTAYRQALVALIEQGIARGELRPQDPTNAALALSALYEGFLELSLLDSTSFDPTAALLAGIDLMMEGIRA